MALSAAGVRIPHDIAIVGLDNVLPAQFSDPPLTTSGVSIPAIGAAAARVLLARLAGAATEPTTSIPTQLMVRQSCGCPHDRSAQALPASFASLDWQTTLGWQLTHLLHPDAVPDPALPPEQSWPAGRALVDGCAAALDRATPVSAEAITRACSDAAAINNDINVLIAIPNLIERMAIGQIIARGDISACERLADYLIQVRGQLLRNATFTTRSLYRETLELVQQNQQASKVLLSPNSDAPGQLDWMRVTTGLAWGCLGLWAGERRLNIVGAYQQPIERDVIDAAAFPSRSFLLADDGRPNPITALIPIGSPERDWGVLAVGITTDYLRAATNYDVLSNLASLLDLALQRQALRMRLHDEHEQAQALAQQVRELGSPVIPLLPGVLLVPLVGALDTARVAHILESTLQGIVDHRAATVLIDLTGVPLVDTQSAHGLVQVTRAATLLGARVHLVGIQPEIAQSIVSLGIDLSMVATEASLAAALQRIGRRGAF